MYNIQSLKSSGIKAAFEKYGSFLVEVRKRLIITLIVFALSTLLGFFFYESIIKFLVGILSLKGINIVFTSPFQFINLAINCGVAMGLIITFPLIVAQILSFLKPALKIKEFRMVVKFIPIIGILFIAGFLFGVFIMKWQISIFLERSVSLGIGNILDISRLLSVVLITSAFMGIGFQFPIVIYLLLRIGIIRHEKLSKIRPWVYLGSFIFAILLPPDSILADILLSLPLIIMFELTLILDNLARKRL